MQAGHIAHDGQSEPETLLLALGPVNLPERRDPAALGRKLRLKGRGIPGNTPGDFYVVLEVVLPPAADDKAKALYRQMAQDLAFDPRQDTEVLR